MTASGHLHLSLCLLPIAAGLFGGKFGGRVDGEVAQKTCSGRLFKVGKSLHWGSPTLSALEVWVQWYRNPSRLETSLAAVDGRDVFGALSRPGHSTTPCIVAFLTVGSYWRSLPLSLPPMSLHAGMGSSRFTTGKTNGYPHLV